MSIDFFIAKCQTENIVDKEFGICDDEDEEKKTPAYVDRNQPDKWVAVVKNQTNQSINFTSSRLDLSCGGRTITNYH